MQSPKVGQGLFPLVPEAAALEDVQKLFGKRLRELREQQHISQEKLAELAGLHRTYVSSVERGERNISLVNIDKLAAALKVSLRDIMPVS